MKIIFVCHGNICRSPAAEWIFKYLAIKYNVEEKFDVYSRATSLEEIGNDIYPPMKRALYSKGIPFYQHKAKRLTQEDYNLADHIYYMDSYNLRNLNALIEDKKHIFEPVTKFTNDISFIDDPWYSGEFEKTVDDLYQCCDDLIRNLLKK